MPDNPQDEPKGSASSQTPIKHILLFCAVVFFFWAGIYLYAPILPVYSQSLGADLSMVGAIVAAYGIPQLLLRIPIGIVFDSLKRKKPLLVAGIVIASVGSLGLGLATNPWMLFAARTVSGIGAATWVSFVVYFSAYYTPGNVNRAVSVLSFMFWGALVVAAYCGGLIAQASGYRQTFFVAAVLGIIALFAVLFTKEPVIAKVERISWSNFKPLAVYPPLLLVCLMGILSTFGDFSSIFGFVPVYGAGIGASSADLGIIAMLSLAAAAVGAILTVRVVKLWGAPLVFLLASILLGITTLTIPLIHDVSLLKAVMLFNGLGRGFTATIVMSLGIQVASPQQRATAMGIFQAALALGMLLGPLLSGFIAQSWGLATVFYLSTFCYLAPCVIAYLPAVKRVESR